MKFPWLSLERITGTGWLPNWTKWEHLARYEFASKYVKDKTIIDCACGSGIGTQKYMLHSPERIFAIDNNLNSLREAKQKFSTPKCIFLKANATNLPIASSEVDVFISLETVEHIYNDMLFFREIARVLKKGGILICSTPNRTVTNPRSNISDKPWNPFHIREYSLSEFTNLFFGQFRIIDCFGQNQVPPFFMWFCKMLSAFIGKKGLTIISKILKLRWIILRSKFKHRVQTVADNAIYEYHIVTAERI